MIKRTKTIADALTQARGALGLCIAIVGFWRGREALPQVVLAVVVCWLTDLLDGPLARRDPEAAQTWIGEHDAEADLSTSVGVTIYLMGSRHLAAWLGVAILLATLGLWFLHSPELAWAFYATPYAVLTLIALRIVTLLGLLVLAYLASVAILRWQRLTGEFIPGFFDAVRDLHARFSGQN